MSDDPPSINRKQPKYNNLKYVYSYLRVIKYLRIEHNNNTYSILCNLPRKYFARFSRIITLMVLEPAEKLVCYFHGKFIYIKRSSKSFQVILLRAESQKFITSFSLFRTLLKTTRLSWNI